MSSEDNIDQELADHVAKLDVATAQMVDMHDPNVEVLEIDKNEGADLSDDDVDADEDIMEDDGQYGDDDLDMADEDDDHTYAVDPNTVVDSAMFTFKEHTDSVYVVASNPLNSSEIATGGGDDTVHVVDIATGVAKYTYTDNKDSIVAIAYNFNGKYLAVGAMDGNVKVYKLKKGDLLVEFDCDDDLVSLSWHQAGNVLLAGTASGLVWMWDVETGFPMHTLAGQSEGINDVQFSFDGKQVLSACQDGSLFVRDAKTGKDVYRFKDSTGHDQAVICVSQTAAYLASGAENGAVHLTNNSNGKILHKLEAHEESVEAMAFGHASIPYLVTASVDCKVKVWDPKNSCQLRHTFPHPDAVTKFQWHPTEPVIATACNDGVVRIFNIKTGKHLHDFTGHTNIILDICFSKDGKYIITCSDDKLVKVFDYSQVPV